MGADVKSSALYSRNYRVILKSYFGLHNPHTRPAVHSGMTTEDLAQIWLLDTKKDRKIKFIKKDYL